MKKDDLMKVIDSIEPQSDSISPHTKDGGAGLDFYAAGNSPNED